MLKKLCIGLLFTLLTLTGYSKHPSYVNNHICLRCHKEQAKEWQTSDHFHSMLPANNKTVLGDFDNHNYQNSQQTVRFFRKDNRFYIAVTPKYGKKTVYKVIYTFGYHPLQQYLLRFPDGKLQVFNIAWDTVKKRWFNVAQEGDLNLQSPFHWTKRFYNWNYACAECHSTHFRKNPTNKGYDSQFAGVNVNCQACHGPGSEHVNWAKNPKGDENALVVNFKTMSSKQKVELCAHCHARRAQVSPVHDVEKPFQNMYIPALLRPDLYHADGQIKDEVFVYGSFIQSKMYQAGVQCMDCHQPHSLKVILPGNQICTQCHNNKPVKRYPELKGKNKDYQSEAHTHHQPDSAGSHCVNCHMPETTYMKIDDRRDHSFKVPNPQLTIAYGIPNACNRCHQDKTPQWALQYIRKWFGRVYQNSPVLTADDAELVAIYQNKKLPDIFRASALMLMTSNKPETIQAFLDGLKDPSPRIIIAALDKLATFNPTIIHAKLKPLLTNDNPIIRGTTAKMLTGSMPATKELESGVLDYLAMQQTNIDQPESHINLAQLFYKQGKKDKAIKSLKDAINIDKHFIPAYLTLVQIYALDKRYEDAINVLQEGINANLNSPELYYNLGLTYGEKKQYKKAQKALERTISIAPDYPRAKHNLDAIKNLITEGKRF